MVKCDREFYSENLQIGFIFFGVIFLKILNKNRKEKKKKNKKIQHDVMRPSPSPSWPSMAGVTLPLPRTFPATIATATTPYLSATTPSTKAPTPRLPIAARLRGFGLETPPPAAGNPRRPGQLRRRRALPLPSLSFSRRG